MLRLTTLGATDLRDRHGQPVRDVLSQPKRVALLAYLAVEGRRSPVPRERLLALFWPESDQVRARNTLSQALHHLRQALGPGVIENHGADAVEVHGEHLWCDASVFADGIERGDVEMALDLYRGEFCPALLVSGAPDVEEWLETQRRGLRSLALRAGRTLAERLEAGGEADRAARAARRALAMQPDEADVRALLALLERCGDAAGAGPPRARRFMVAAALTLGVAAVAAWLGTRRVRAVRVDAGLVAVAPFRVAGADTGLAFLREGMLDLLAAKLTGEGGLRATDPRTIVSAWPHQRTGALDDLPDSTALRVARSLGAGRLLLGSVVGRERQLTLTAAVVETRRGTVRADATVSGRLDRLPELVDALAAQLLSEDAGEPAPRLPSLTSASLPALKAYLDGRSAFRAGRYAESQSDLWHAVELDSTFAIAWSELVQVADWVVGSDTRARVGPIALAFRNRLSAPDRALLEASLGPGYPVWPSYRHRLEAWERAARLAPERPEAWYGLGDAYFHIGQLLGRDSGFVQAEGAFARAVALDSAFIAPLVHLVQIAVLRSDTAALRRLWALYVRRDTTSESAVYLRWRVAMALGDSATARLVEAAFDTLPVGVLNRIATWASVDAVGIETAWRAARTAMLRSSGADQLYTRRIFLVLSGNLGRFAEREAAWLRERRIPITRAQLEADRVNSALAMDGDTAAARAALARLRSTATRADQGLVACTLAGWSLLLPAQREDTTGLGAAFRACGPQVSPGEALRLRALYAARTGNTALESLLGRLDSARQAAEGTGVGNIYSLVQGRILMMRGDYAAARDAFRHRELGGAEANGYYAPLLRWEGRAAELAGDAAGARRAYRLYLALRASPDPGCRVWADTVRAALARLEHRPQS